MIITVTSIRLKSVWSFFTLSYHGLKISLQAKKEKGFIKMKNTGFGYLHHTLSCWESEEDVKRFARSGAHLEAMKQSQRLASEIRVYTFSGDELPDWKQTSRLLEEKGKSFVYK
jgi:hypothetical protein